jgi:hypothetical protein
MVILSVGHFVKWSFCQMVILSIGHFVKWSFFQMVILSVGHFVKWSFCQMDILSIGHFVKSLFKTNGHFSTRFIILSILEVQHKQHAIQHTQQITQLILLEE